MTTSVSPLPNAVIGGLGRPKDLVKRAAILLAAKDLFLRLGYDGSSMDAIAAEAKVSKLTVYSHFNDKETLFAAAIEAHCINQLPPSIFDLTESASISEVLYGLAYRFQQMINSQESIELHRLLVTLSVQKPEKKRLFYDAGPQRTLDETARLLEQANAQGKLCIPNSMLAAEYFLASFSGCTQLRLILAIDGVEDRAAGECYAREVVQRFVRAYRV
jgi:TetR/AcrR family transcriptional repressor of mexJK operon